MKIIKLSFWDRLVLKSILPLRGNRSDIGKANFIEKILEFTEEEAEKYEIERVLIGMKGGIFEDKRKKIGYFEDYDKFEWITADVNWPDQHNEFFFEFVLENDYYSYLKSLFLKSENLPRDEKLEDLEKHFLREA